MPDDGKSGPPRLDLFVGEPTRDIESWAWLWTGDHFLPVHGRPGLWRRALAAVRRLGQSFLRRTQSDLWERQRVFNLIALELLETVRAERQFRAHQLDDHQKAIEAHARLLEQHDRRLADGLTDVLHHNDALFARVDQKLDGYRREARELWHRLGAMVAASEAGTAGDDGAVERRRVQVEQGYVELERRYRGSEEEIAERLAVYLPYLAKAPGEVLDLGCGRGEGLEVLRQQGLEARGVDASGEMVARCQEKGLRAESADLFGYLQGLGEASLGAIVSFHVIEHLPAESLERLVRLTWRALRPGGLLILETPSPLSLVMAARNFWIDPTHRRPVHPASLEVAFREAGFEPVHRLDLHPFPPSERLPEIDLAALPELQRELADQVNRLRDILDDLLFGDQDFGMVGIKPT